MRAAVLGKLCTSSFIFYKFSCIVCEGLGWTQNLIKCFIINAHLKMTKIVEEFEI
jgi:hypothetical protein